MARCRACPAEITFGKTVKGRRIPLDLGTDPGGNVVIDRDGISRVFNSPTSAQTFIAQEGLDPERQRMPHHASCPNARRFRGRKK